METGLVPFDFPAALSVCTAAGPGCKCLKWRLAGGCRGQGELRTFSLKPCCFSLPFSLDFLSAFPPERAGRWALCVSRSMAQSKSVDAQLRKSRRDHVQTASRLNGERLVGRRVLSLPSAFSSCPALLLLAHLPPLCLATPLRERCRGDHPLSSSASTATSSSRSASSSNTTYSTPTCLSISRLHTTTTLMSNTLGTTLCRLPFLDSYLSNSVLRMASTPWSTVNTTPGPCALSTTTTLSTRTRVELSPPLHIMPAH